MILIIDDDPGRYCEFCLKLDKEGVSWVITCDFSSFSSLLVSMRDNIKCILLDHDMPRDNGTIFASHLADWYPEIPVIISSASKEENIRNIEEKLKGKTHKWVRLSASLNDPEVKWYYWALGATGGSL